MAKTNKSWSPNTHSTLRSVSRKLCSTSQFEKAARFHLLIRTITFNFLCKDMLCSVFKSLKVFLSGKTVIREGYS